MSGAVRKSLVVLPTIITIAVVAVAGTALLVQRQDRSDKVAEAERVGSTYFSDVATFRADLQAALQEVEDRDPGTLKDVVDKALESPPQLGAPPEAAEESRTYREAVKASATVLDPYRTLSKRLGRADEAQPFVDAAEKLLGKSPAAMLGFGLVYESTPLRQQVIPELTEALREFRAVPVPKGAKKVARTVEGAVQYVIGQVSVMADRSDAGKTYEFDYGDEYQDARQAVQDYATEVNGDVTEALDRVSGDSPT